jgi:hypothetical protein
MNIFMVTQGRGLGASHQTGWTALLAELINEIAATLPKREKAKVVYDDED